MKIRIPTVLAIVLAAIAAICLAPASAGSQGERVAATPAPPASAQAPACSPVPPGRKVEVEPPDSKQPLPGPLCTASFCSANEGHRCLAGPHCNGQNKGKCIYTDTLDASCVFPDPLPTSWCGGCT